MLTADKNLHKATVFFFSSLSLSLPLSGSSSSSSVFLRADRIGMRYKIILYILQCCQTRPLLIECPRGCTHCPRITTIFALQGTRYYHTVPKIPHDKIRTHYNNVISSVAVRTRLQYYNNNDDNNVFFFSTTTRSYAYYCDFLPPTDRWI